MNTSKVQTLINELIAEVQNNRQYPISKAQEAQLKELGIYDMMPMTQVKNGRRFIGYTDAAIVIEAATTGKTALMNAFGEGEEIPADALNAALSEKEAVTAETIVATPEFKVGQVVCVLPHTQYTDLYHGATHSIMDEHRHNGYYNAEIVSMSSDGSVEIEVDGYGIDIVDISHLKLI